MPPWDIRASSSRESRSTGVSRCWATRIGIHYGKWRSSSICLLASTSARATWPKACSGIASTTYGKMAAFTELAVDIFLRNGVQLNDLLMSGVLARYPKIKFVSVESGIGWIPFMLEAMDYQFQGNSVAEEHPEFDLLPSEYFARNVYACYWFEQTAPRRLIDKIGVDNILFETDFPHPTSLYGQEVHARIKGGLSDCEDSVRRKILWGNAQKLYKVTGPSAADEAKL